MSLRRGHGSEGISEEELEAVIFFSIKTGFKKGVEVALWCQRLSNKLLPHVSPRFLSADCETYVQMCTYGGLRLR